MIIFFSSFSHNPSIILQSQRMNGVCRLDHHVNRRRRSSGKPRVPPPPAGQEAENVAEAAAANNNVDAAGAPAEAMEVIVDDNGNNHEEPAPIPGQPYLYVAQFDRGTYLYPFIALAGATNINDSDGTGVPGEAVEMGAEAGNNEEEGEGATAQGSLIDLTASTNGDDDDDSVDTKAPVIPSSSSSN